MTQRTTTTNSVWTNPADPFAQYRYGKPNVWNDDAATTQQPARVVEPPPAPRDCCADVGASLVLLVVALGVVGVLLWQLADRPRE
jgi:hypothetical protein